MRTLRPALRWLAKREHCAADLANIEQPVTVRKRERRLNREELADLLPVLNDGSVMHGSCLRFILSTACRLGEALEARWWDIDWREGLWTIPQTKSRIEHVIPLPWQAVALLHHLRPAETDPDALVFATESGHRLSNWDRTSKWFKEHSGTGNWHRHDLRRTAATLMGDLGTEPHIIESVLGHITLHTGLASIYNRARYRPQMEKALQQLADLLDDLEHGKAKTEAPVSLAA